MENVWALDRINRQKDAKLLLAFLLEKNRKAVLKGERGVSVNISAPWGAGKTFFLSRFAKQLRQENYCVAQLDAWRDDHTDDPVVAVMHAVLQGIGKKQKTALKVVSAFKKNFGRIGWRLVKGGFKRAATVLVDKDEVEGIRDDMANTIASVGDETISAFADAALANYDAAKQAVEDFRKSLVEIVTKIDKKPLFIVVDELDRCRPTYAILLLERLKHLFDVPNVVFLVATNLPQLAHTIRAVYGQGFDAERYLFRFFDRTYALSPPPLAEFVAVQWEHYELSSDRFISFHGIEHQQVVASIAEVLGMSMRDVIQAMDLLTHVSEQFYPTVKLPLPYVFCLCCVFQQANLELFDYLTVNERYPEKEHLKDFLSMLPADKIFGRPAPGQVMWAAGSEMVSLRDIAKAFRSFVAGGLADGEKDPNLLGLYVEKYRVEELGKLNGDGGALGSGGRSILRELPGIIASVGGTLAAPKEA
ncbi:P-loop NTPase fold protein [Aminobacter sp. AP02]|uniref:KAP family P-loop NTPase fold protein n=1 Tax=Aminobacter sp. AP02 TaxID=2135737 RepID=UPI000D7B41A5|nr:P-loop NTPase fold protein [Aminobacter sp. AP02]PWK75492.1 KAP-like P-loop domain-containing protein [Aminobacter sp. AP02]